MRRCRACDLDKAKARDRVVCERVFGKPPKAYWEREPGYVRDEVRRALRRTPTPRERVEFVLPLPTLLGEARRLAAQEITTADGTVYRGPKAAEEWVSARRRQLGLE